MNQPSLLTNDETILERIEHELAQALYRHSEDFDPSMPELWQRGFMTREPHLIKAAKIISQMPLLQRLALQASASEDE
jgi:hypothetical protein